MRSIIIPVVIAVIAVAAIILGLSMRLGAREAQAATTATFTVNAPAGSQALATPFNVTIDMSGVTFDGVSTTWGGYDIEMSFDSSFLTVNSIESHLAPWPGLCVGSNWGGSDIGGAVVTGCAFQSSTTTSGMLERINFTCSGNGTSNLTLVARPGTLSLGTALFDENSLDFGMTLVNDTVTCGPPPASATFAVDAPVITVPLSTPFDATVNLAGVTFDANSPTWGGYDIELSYNPAVLQVNSIAAHTTPWAGLCPGANWGGSDSIGTVVIGCAFQSSTQTSGMLEQISFSCKANGTSPLTLVPRPGVYSLGTGLLDENALDFQMTLLSRSVTCYSPLPPNQTIHFVQAAKTYGDPDFDLVAFADSGLPVTFAISGSCSVLGNTVHIVAAGTCTAIASQAGNEIWNPAVDVAVTFAINKANQSISFPSPPTKRFDESPLTVSASASSGLPVSFVSLSPSKCTVAGTSVMFGSLGTCVLQAEQAGDGNYNPASQQASFEITKGTQSITFPPLPDRYVGEPDFSVIASASSGLPILWGVSGNCTNPSGATIHLTAIAPGTCSVTAFQLGDSNWNAAPNVSRTFNIVLADADADGCDGAGELLLVPPTNPSNPWDFYSVPVPALIAAPNPLLVFKDNVVGAADAQAIFAYFKRGAQTGTPEYEQDLNGNGVKDGLEYDRSFAGPGMSGPPNGVVSAQDAQLAFAQFKMNYRC